MVHFRQDVHIFQSSVCVVAIETKQSENMIFFPFFCERAAVWSCYHFSTRRSAPRKRIFDSNTALVPI